MEFGISFLPDTGPAQRSAQDFYDNLLRLSCLAEDLDLDYVKMTEHYLRPYGGYCASPISFLSAVAMRSERIRLMTGGIQASFHHPIQIAAEAAQLDALSHGRLEVGFARAFLPYEFEALGVDIDTSRERFRETVAAVLRLWTEDKVSEDGPFFRYSDVCSLPLPTQRPHPPVWVAALLTPSSFEWIGQNGFNLLVASPPRRDELPRTREMIQSYRDAFASTQPPDRSPKVAVSIPLLVADTDEEARRSGVELLGRHWNAFADAATSWRDVSSPSYEGYQAAVTKKLGNNKSADDLDSTAVLGGPATVLERIQELAEVLSIDVALWHIDFGQQPYATMERSLRLFADAVRPHLP